MDSLFSIDQKKEQEKEQAYQTKERFEMVSIQLQNTVFSKSESRMFGFVFGKADSKGRGKGAFIDEYSGAVEKFRYQISDYTEQLEIRPNNGGESKTVTFGNGVIWVDGDGYKALYGEDKYNGLKKYI